MMRLPFAFWSVTAFLILVSASCFWGAATVGQESSRGIEGADQRSEAASAQAREHKPDQAPAAEPSGPDRSEQADSPAEPQGDQQTKVVYEYGVLPENESMPACNCKAPLVNGQLHGTVIAYDDQDRVIARLKYNNGILDGESRTFFPSGKLFSARRMKNGAPTGIGFNYFEDGTVAMWENHDENIQIEYFRNGNKFIEGQLVWEGLVKRRHGVWKFYLPDGRLYLLKQYQLGTAIAERNLLEPTEKDLQAMRERWNFSARVKDHWN